ncbi:hypothetical protein, partial [Flavobacterium sp.]|uniref:hypothetical protein n=1 Tax=Flavobacterium sp. TaxID=239 RepID=UPI002635A766
MYVVLPKTSKPKEDTVWNGTLWSNGMPNAYKNAVLTANYSTTLGSFSCNNLTLTDNTELTVIENTYVKVIKDLNQSLNSLITVKNLGNFILLDNKNLHETARVSVERIHYNLQRLDYIYFSSPISGIILKSVSPLTLNNRFYALNELSNIYTILDPTNEIVPKGKGYSIRTPNNFTNTPTNFIIKIDNTLSGTLNSGINKIDISNHGSGFNLTGNIYLSSISASKFLYLNKNQIESKLFVWDERTNGSQGSVYKMFNLITNNYNNNFLILPTQGFAILCKIPNTISQLCFTPDMQLIYPNYSDADRFHINLKQQNVNFPIGSICYDLEIFPENFSNIEQLQGTTISIFKNDKNYLIYREKSVLSSVVLHINVNIAANYYLYLRDFSGLFSNNYNILLTDTLQNTTHNLKTADYHFFSEAGTFTDRFIL